MNNIIVNKNSEQAINIQVKSAERGAQGEQGIQGIQGIQGEKGERGLPGTPGRDGRDGAIQYTAGVGINITAENVIEATGEASTNWGDIGGNIENQNDLKQKIIDSVAWGKIGGNIASQTDLIAKIPTKTSQLTNDSNFPTDPNYNHTDNNFTTTEKSKLNGIANGAQANVIESVSLNGSALTPTNKNVNINASNITVTATDPGEGATLAPGNFIAVY